MKKKSLYLFCETNFTDRDYERFCVKSLNNKFDVKVIDLNYLFTKKYIETEEKCNSTEIDYFFFKKLKNFKIFINEIPKKSVVISLIGVRKETFFIYKLLYQRNIKFGFICLGTTPDTYKFLKNYYYSKIRVLKKYIFNLIYNSISKIESNFFIIGSEADKLRAKNNFIHNKSSIFFEYNSLDFNLFSNYNKNSKNNKYLNKSFAVFLDEFNPYHPDNKLNGYTFCKKKYYSELNLLFSRIEKKFNLNVYIAAHPRSNYKIIGNPYSNRLIFKNKTDYLIRQSKFVIAHASTALNFAVLNKKPVLLVKSKNYPHRYNKSISVFAKELNCETVFIDDKIREYKLSIDKNSYDMYVKKFIKINPNLNVSFDIIMNNINNDLL